MKSISKINMIIGCLIFIGLCLPLNSSARDFTRSEKGFDELDEAFDENPAPRQQPQRQSPPPTQLLELPDESKIWVKPSSPPPTVVEEEPEPEVITKTSTRPMIKKVEGLTFELKDCLKDGNAVNCNFLITSDYFDRVVQLFLSSHGGGHVVKFYDNFGTEHPVHLIRMVDKESRYSKLKHQLIADIPIPVTFRFENVSTRTTIIAKLLIGGSATKNSQRHYFMPEFRKVQITQ